MRPRLLRYAPTVLAFVGALAWIVWRAREPSFGDEWRYVWYAQNLLGGAFTPRDNPMIWNGPGYPVLLMPFAALELPVLVPKLFNAVLVAAAVAFTQATLRRYTTTGWAAVGAMTLALLPASVQHLQFTYTEPLSLALLSAAIYFARHRPLLGGALFAATIMVKVLFGPVLLLMLLVMAGLRRVNVALLLAFALCVPWLAYTHSVSGRWLHWSSASGQMLYWLATPWSDEKGDWFHHRAVKNTPLLFAHHGAIYEQLKGPSEDTAGTEVERVLPGIGKLASPEADLEFRRMARENALAHPLLFARNWVFNVGRLLVDAPFTFPRAPDWWVVAGHLGLVIAALMTHVRRRERWTAELKWLAAFTFVTFALLSLLSANARLLIPLYPAFVVLAFARGAQGADGAGAASGAGGGVGVGVS